MAGLSNSFPKYAPVEDLAAYLGVDIDVLSPPTEVIHKLDGLLARASAAIRVATKTAFYGVAADGFTPSDQVKADAMHDAAILQAAAYYHAGIEPGQTVADLPQSIQSKTLGARSVTYATNSTKDDTLAALMVGSLSPEAYSVLSQARLITTHVAMAPTGRWNILTRQWEV